MVTSGTFTKRASKLDVNLATEQQHKEASTVATEEEHKDNEHSMRPRKFVHETFEEISEIILSGLLAIIVWFIISQGALNANVYTLGAISLTVGLVTKEIVLILKELQSKLRL